jgi:hypothetical protein
MRIPADTNSATVGSFGAGMKNAKTSSRFGILMFSMLFAVTAILLNALFYLSLAMCPLIRSDAWHFLDALVIKWSSEGFHIADCFVKRSITDHAQPLNKILLYLNYRIFRLDFMAEALCGFAGLFLFVCIAFFLFCRSMDARRHNLIASAMFFVCALMTLTSMNTTEFYTWSLVAFELNYFTLAVMAALAIWACSSSQKWGLNLSFLLVLLCIMILSGDTASVIAWAAIFPCVLLKGLRSNGRFRRQCFIILGIGTAMVVLYYVIIYLTSIHPASFRVKSQTGGLLSGFSAGTFVEAFLIVFSSAVIHQMHLSFVGSAAERVIEWFVSIVLFFFYMRFFVKLLFSKINFSVYKYFVMFVLMHASASVLFIMIGRAPEYGIQYLWQPRYVLIYQEIPFALLLDCSLSKCWPTQNRALCFRTLLRWCFFILYISLQIFFCFKAYKALPWISRYFSEQAVAIGYFSRNPKASIHDNSGATGEICRMPQDYRNRLIQFLKTENLNLFNSGFQWSHRFFPNQVVSECIGIENWGPRSLKGNEGAEQPNRPPGLWIMLSENPGAQLISVSLKNIVLPTVQDGQVIAVEIPAALLRNQGTNTLLLKWKWSDHEQKVGEFIVY